MKHKFANALSLAVILSMLFTSVGLADTIQSDGDIVTANIQTTVNLGTVASGTTLTPKISFHLSCAGNRHVDNGQSVILTYNAVDSTIPSGGSLSATTASIGSIPVTWPDDGNNDCTGFSPIGDNGDSTVTIVAPSAGGNYSFIVAYSAALTPPGGNDPASITGAVPTVTYTLTVVSNTAPSVSLTGVTDGASYDKGSVPAATCQVTDSEDGNSSFPATLSAVTGPNDADGLGSQTASCSYTDGGGLTASASATYSIGDPSAPGISYVLNPAFPDGSNDWYKSEVSLTWIVTENESPNSLVVSGCVDQDILADQDVMTYSCSATSAGGSAGPVSVSIKRDGTAPTISGSASPTANVNGWNNGDVTVSFTCDDNLSGVVSCEPDATLTGEGAGQSVTGNVSDNAGNTNSTTVSGINIDKTAPTASASASPAANGNGWNNTDVTVSFSGSDALSGIDTCSASVTLSSEGTGQSTSGTCTDKAGNVSAEASASVSIDKTAPSVSLVDGPVDGGIYYFGFVPAAPTCSASDALSGLDGSCSVAGYSAAVGSHTVSAEAKDLAGNEGSASATYTVNAWTLSGFYQPVDMDKLNTVKGGSTVPLKFEIFAGSTELTNTSYVQSLQAYQVACTFAGSEDAIETISTGATSLRYDTIAGQFIFNWQTPKKPGNCYMITMTTLDGSSLSANFKLK